EIDIHNQRSRTIETPINGAVAYLADETGRVRVMLRRPLDGRSQLMDTVHSFYRTEDSDEWKPLAVSDTSGQDASGFYPVAVDSKQNVVFGFDKKGVFDALYTISLDGSGKRELALSRDEVDVDGLMRIGRRNRVVGASYATDARHSVYFDPNLRSLAGELERALPTQPMISFVDASEDESKLLIVAASESDPGMSYLFDKSGSELNALIPLRPELSGRVLAKMKPIQFTASDGTIVPGYLTLPPGKETAKGLPAIVMPHGGPGARDELGFDWLVQFFAAQGYAVMQPNFRGSSGYGSEWFGKNGFKAWPTAIGDINDAGKWLVVQGIADPSKLAIVGWSYGGYAALQAQVVDPDLYKAVVAIAPVTDLDLLKRESYYFTNHGIASDFIGEGEHIRTGSPARHASEFKAPVLLFHGTIDQNVAVEQSRLMERQLKGTGKSVEYHEFEGLAHSLDSSDVRAEMLAASAAFLSRNLGN
ncbi:MAG: S9 family peptidase, partial [Pseudomonadota bacterium]|nr:S9 family peptidase [Pseudomonadota bacterium]